MHTIAKTYTAAKCTKEMLNLIKDNFFKIGNLKWLATWNLETLRANLSHGGYDFGQIKNNRSSNMILLHLNINIKYIILWDTIIEYYSII